MFVYIYVLMHKSPPIISPKARGSASIYPAKLQERIESKLGAVYVQEVINKHPLNILNDNSLASLRVLFTAEKLT